MYIINIRRHLQTHSGRVLLLTLTLLALYLRTRALSSDPRVVWDAVHFGTFANNYIHREFFLDVHQPFGRLLITLLFQMFGYTGDYTFVSGENYSSSVPFVQMRAVQAVVGTLLVPLSFAMCQALRMPLVSVWLAAVFVTLENAFIGIARLNVLDNMLLVASAGAVSAFAVVERMHTKQRICTSHIVMLGLALALLLKYRH
ncbi:Dolichyl-phosphate-mannose--protein mannosyltransferase 1 [Coemansia sp. RSA 2440]|nr:Dolichyl-phosphate-mannose--protein mannosyltransferase 1 [Coemansia sp. RSA 2440]